MNRISLSPCRVVLSAGMLSLSSLVAAQDSLQITFVGDRELELREVRKPLSNPLRIDLGLDKPDITYAPIAKTVSPTTEVHAIDPAPVRMDAPLPRLYGGYAKGGFGLYTSPLAHIHYGDTQSRNGAWGFTLRHESSAGSTGQVDSLDVDEGWSNTGASAYYRRFIDRSSLTLNGGWNRQAWGLHGLDLSRAAEGGFSAPTDRQNYSRLNVSARLQNHERDSTKVHRDIDLRASRLSIGLSPQPGDALLPEILLPNGRENLLTGRAAFHSWRDDAWFRLDLEGHLIGSQIDATGDSTSTSVNRSSALIGAVPSVTKERGAFMVRVGAGLWVDARGRQAFHFYPKAEVRFRLLDDVFVPYGGVDGSMQRNAMHDLVAENPWFDARYHAGPDALRGTLHHTNRAMELYGGVRGKFTRDLAFNGQARTVQYRDFAYWVNEAGADSAGQRFSLAFDTLTVASVIGEANYRGQGPLELSARIEFNTYGTGTQAHAWYQPRSRMSASARWNLEELLFLRAKVDIVGARYAPSRTPFSEVVDGETVIQEAASDVGNAFGDGDIIHAQKLPAYTAIDLSVEYRYNGRLSMGLDARGPLGQTQLFNGVNAQRLGVIMWAGYRF